MGTRVDLRPLLSWTSCWGFQDHPYSLPDVMPSSCPAEPSGFMCLFSKPRFHHVHCAEAHSGRGHADRGGQSPARAQVPGSQSLLLSAWAGPEQ